MTTKRLFSTLSAGVELLPKVAIAIAGASTLAITASVPSANAFSIFFGEDLNVGGNGNTPLSSFPNAVQAEADFLSNLSGVGTEDFEGFSVGQTSPLTLTFPGVGTATLSGSGSINTDSSLASFNGTYPISGNQNFLTFVGDGGFNATLDQPVAAFGFYVSDLGDLSSSLPTQLNLQLGLADGSTTNLVVPHSTFPTAGSGSVIYYGIIADNSSEAFTNIAFTFAGGTSNDGIGLDDITIGSFEQVQLPVESVPEPATILGLVTALGFGGLLKRQQKLNKKANH